MVLIVTSQFIAMGSDDSASVKVLIIDGFSNHDWQTTTARIREILQRDGGFECVVSTSPDSTAKAEAWDEWTPPIAQTDVVLLNCNDLGKPVHWPDRVRSALESFVEKGGGLYVFHSANNAFADWPAYNRMIGIGWRNKNFGAALEIDDDGTVRIIPAGEGDGTGHGARVDALVRRLGEHPIHRGLPREWRAADVEVYTYARGPAENIEVLSYSRDNAFKKGFPIEWVVSYGKGRVYSSSLGHLWKGDTNPPAFRCAGFQTLLVRTLRWLAGREVETAVPADFPTVTSTSLRSD
jgi:type 1 glutamine amidotransferase